MSYAVCESCSRDILWAVTGKGKRMPIDPQPRGDGNLAVYRDVHGSLRARVLKKGEQLESYERPAMPHWATCPYADRHRKKPNGLPGNVVDLDARRKGR